MARLWRSVCGLRWALVSAGSAARAWYLRRIQAIPPRLSLARCWLKNIEACFDRIDHTALLDRVRARIKDKRVLTLVKAFLKSGIMTELGDFEDTDTGTPQGSLCAAAHNDPYEQRWVMRSVRGLPPVEAVAATERCA